MHTKIHTKNGHKSRHDEKPKFETYRDIGWKPKICQNGHKFWVQAYTTIKYKKRHPELRTEQQSDRIPNLQAHGAKINIFVARHRTEFEFPTHLCPLQLITKCVHKNNSSTHQNNTTNATGQKWDRTAVAKQSATSNVTYSTLSNA
jgi:hypothetical protein